jgi:hypothetical protein
MGEMTMSKEIEISDFERVRELGDGLPAPRPQVREAARAALVARFEAGRAATASPRGPRRFFRRRNLALAGSLAALATALLIALGTGGGSGVKPDVASAADLDRLAELAPRLAITGGWQITDTEASPEDGATRFHYERDPSSDATDAEIQWHVLPVEEVEKRLEAEGFEAAGTQPTRTLDSAEWRAANYDAMYSPGTAQVFVSSEDDLGRFQAVGVWRAGGWSFELSAGLDRLDSLERLLERLEVLGPDEWLVALQPGGAEWLRKSLNGTVKKLENVNTEGPDGTVVSETRALIRTPEELEEVEFTAPFPVVYREGDRVRAEIERAPE